MLIPPQNMEIERIYSQMLGKEKQAIAICTANSGEGATSIALALAQHNLLAGHSTLLVDLNLYHPSFNKLLELKTQTSESQLLGSPQLISTGNQSIAITGVTAPEKRDLIFKLRKPGVLELCITEWHKTFNTVIIDTSPINRINANNIPPERVAAACDGCLLVVLAGKTNEAMINTAVNKLKSVGANLLGCIFNDRDNPPLKNELLRELRRINPRYNKITTRIESWIRNNRLLSMEL